MENRFKNRTAAFFLGGGMRAWCNTFFIFARRVEHGCEWEGGWGERERGVYAYFNAILINLWWWMWPHLISKKRGGGGRGPFFASDAVLTSFSPLLPQSCFGCYFLWQFKKNWDGFFWKIGCDKLRRLQKDIFGDLNARSYNEQKSQRKNSKTNSFFKKRVWLQRTFFLLLLRRVC